jgi:hypothetical protein
VKRLNHGLLTFNARRLDSAVQRGYPVDFRTSAQIEAASQFEAILDHHGGALINLIESMLFPAMKRLRSLNASTYMRRTVLGAEDDISVEVGLGYHFSYTFSASHFYPERLLAIFNVHMKEIVGDPLHSRDYRYDWQTLGGLADIPEGLTWLYIPQERWRQAGTRPHMVDFTGLPPLEDHLGPVLDRVVERINSDAKRWRRENGYPVHPSELGEYRYQQLLRRLNYGT